MNKKNNNKKNLTIPVNFLNNGGFWKSPGAYAKEMNNSLKMSAGMGIATGILDLGTSAIGNLLTDTYNPQQFNAGSNEALLAQSASYIPEQAHTESVAGNAVSGALKGALAGMAFGPWGAAIGAGVGLLSEGITTVIGNKKEEEAAKTAKMQSIRNMGTNAQNIGQMNSLNKQSQYFAEGGGIHIAPSKRGTFTAAATKHGKGVQEFASQVLANKDNYSPAMVKKANFARNAAKWHHADGGDLLFVAPEDVQYLATGGALMPREPLSNKDTMMMNHMNQFADGGPMGNGVTQFNNGGTHEENPMGGIPQGIGMNGLPNLVEEGEVKYKDYIFSDRLKASKTNLSAVGLPERFVGKTYGQIAKNLQKESAERPNDPISQRGLADMMQKLKESQETTKAIKQAKELNVQMQQFAKGGNLFDGEGNSQLNFNLKPIALSQSLGMQGPDINTIGNNLTNKVKSNINNELALSALNSTNKSQGFDTSYLRYAPVLASGLQAFSDQAGWTNKADTTLADTISNQGVKATRLTDKMNYQPLDTRWAQNQAAAQLAATRQGILDTAGGNRATAMAGLIGADYAGGLQAGQLARQAAEYNQAQQQRVAEFNRATNQYNAEVDKWEQATRMQNIIQGAQAKENTIQQAAAVRSANLNNFLGNITGVGQEAMNRNMITSNPSLYYTVGADGKLRYKTPEEINATMALLNNKKTK